MPKGTTFADKMSKKKQAVICRTCESPIESVLYVKPYRDDEKGSWKYHEQVVGVCKCNQKEIYG